MSATAAEANYEYFYINKFGRKRSYGIFAPGIDRFILVDYHDFWMTLQTAELLSSKLPTMAYVLPAIKLDIDNSNCINYTIADKTQQKVGPSSMIVGRQQPMLKFLYASDKLSYDGIPEDYKDRLEILNRIMLYAQYVHKRVYAMNLAEAMHNIKNTSQFVQRYVDNNWMQGLTSRPDRSELEKGVFFELRKILYLSDSPEEAESKITAFLKDNIADQAFLVNSYYRILEVPVPADVELAIKQGPKKLSTFLF